MGLKPAREEGTQRRRDPPATFPQVCTELFPVRLSPLTVLWLFLPCPSVLLSLWIFGKPCRRSASVIWSQHGSVYASRWSSTFCLSHGGRGEDHWNPSPSGRARWGEINGRYHPYPHFQCVRRNDVWAMLCFGGVGARSKGRGKEGGRGGRETQLSSRGEIWHNRPRSRSIT